jgi:hypothetical protein
MAKQLVNRIVVWKRKQKKNRRIFIGWKGQNPDKRIDRFGVKTNAVL